MLDSHSQCSIFFKINRRFAVSYQISIKIGPIILARFCVNFKTVINYLAVFTVFAEAITYNFRFWWGFKLYNFGLVILIIILGIKLKEIIIPRTFAILFSLLVLFSSAQILLGNNSARLFLSQAVAILVQVTAFYILIRFNDYDIRRLFHIYLNVAFIIALIGIMQEIGYIVADFKPVLEKYFKFKWAYLYDLKSYLPLRYWDVMEISRGGMIRVNSILPEPTAFCMAMMPSFFAALASFGKNAHKFISRKRGSVIITAFILSFSLVGYVGIVISLILLLSSNRRLRTAHVILCSLVIIILAVSMCLIFPDFRFRVVDTYNVITGQKDAVEANQSTYTIVRNASVTYHTLLDSYFLGMGLGSHETSFKRHAKKGLIAEPLGIAVLNTRDANSLFLRVLSETGIIGIMILLAFIFIYRLSAPEGAANYLWIISNSIFVLFMIRLLRQGNYMSEGFIFFIYLYYYAKRLAKAGLSS